MRNITGYYRIRVSADCTTWFDTDNNLFYQSSTKRRGDSLKIDNYNYQYPDHIGFDASRVVPTGDEILSYYNKKYK